jgi:hypothetical protein
MAIITAADIPTGHINGTFYFVSEDNADADTDPTLTVVSGNVTFTPVTHTGQPIQRLQLVGKLATAIPRQFNAKFNAQGQLVPLNGNGIGLKLPASSAPQFNPTGWKWRVEYNLTYAGTNVTVNLPTDHFTLDTGEVKDLTEILPLIETETVITIRGEKGEPGPAKFPTGTRPSASVAGAGGIFFDTALKKPLWSTGTAWVDATGVVVP